MILRMNTVLRAGPRHIGAPSGPLIWLLGQPPAGPPLRPVLTVQFFMVSLHPLRPVWQLSYDFQYKHTVRFFMISLRLLWPVRQHSNRFQWPLWPVVSQCRCLQCCSVLAPVGLSVVSHNRMQTFLPVSSYRHVHLLGILR
jgi:hypothetical protein